MKALLVIDLPDGTNIENLIITYIVQDIKNPLTPLVNELHGKVLKPMPEKKYAIQGMKGYATTVKECKGYNKCITEILGGNNNE